VQLVGKLVVLLVKTLNGHASPVTVVMGVRTAMIGRTVPRVRDASTSVFREVETSAYELTKWHQNRCAPMSSNCGDFGPCACGSSNLGVYDECNYCEF
jgi:hypothetical protein